METLYSQTKHMLQPKKKKEKKREKDLNVK